MRHYKNDYKMTWRDWCLMVEAQLWDGYQLTLFDVMYDVDLGDYWMAGCDASEIAYDLRLEAA